MKIVDIDNILPESSILEEVISNHPFHNDLVNQLDTVTVKRAIDRIEILPEGINVTLFMSPCRSVDEQIRFILYHEIGHVADRLNPHFKYSEEVRRGLNDRQVIIFKELWNLYIDARLNRCNIYRHSPGRFARWANGQLIEVIRTQDTQLIERVDLLSKRGFNNASLIVQEIWNDPMKEFTFLDLVNLVKVNMCKA